MQRSHGTDPATDHSSQKKSDQKRDGGINKSEYDGAGSNKSRCGQKGIEMKKNFHASDVVLAEESGLKEQEKEESKKNELCDNS